MISPAEFLNNLNFNNGSYCRYLWSWHAEKAWQAVGHRASRRSVTTLTAFKSAATGWCGVRGETLSSLDLFYTPNEFFDWRNTRQLAQLHANWLEIDTTGHAVLDADILDEVLTQLQEAEMPIPSGFVRSGSGGLHLYWIYEGCSAYRGRVQQWRQITDSLISALRGGATWHVDTAASRDPARVLRLPGSVHGKSGRLVNGYTSRVVYTFDSLAEAVGLSPQPPLQVVKSLHAPAPAPAPVSVPAPSPNGRHTIRGWWSQTYWQIVSSLRKQRPQQGTRDLTAFILFVALRHMHDDAQAEQKIESLNTDLIGLPERELQNNLQTARRIRYKYRKSTLASYLSQIGIDTAYLYQTTAPKLTQDEIHRAQSVAGTQTSAARRSDTLKRLIEAATDICMGRVLPSISDVATAAGRSVRTVQRYWREVQSALATNAGASIYAP